MSRMDSAGAAIRQDELKVATQWAEWVEKAEPLGVAYAMKARTDRPVDVAGLAESVREVAAR